MIANRHTTNEFGQPIGSPVKDWEPRPFPPLTTMQGRYCRLDPLNPQEHADSLFESYTCETAHDGNWTYLPYGPFHDHERFYQWQLSVSKSSDTQFYAIVNQLSGRAVGMASYLRMTPQFGSMEVGHIHYSPQLQKTPAATEAMYLMMCRAFDELGYRRCEWKCDSLNQPSRRAAQRLGFTFEGIFRQHLMYKGRSRDTAWFSMIGTEWPSVKANMENWLSPDNFDESGKQRSRLAR